MGLRDWFKSSGGNRARAAGPSAEHPTTLAAIRHLIEAHIAAGDDGLWLSLHGTGSGRKATIELADDQINFCTEEVGLPDLLRSLGCDELAAVARAGGKRADDRSLWTIAGASPEQLSMLIDVAFARALGLGDVYTVEGERHD